MLDRRLMKIVLLEKTYGALSLVAKETMLRQKDRATTSGLIFTQPAAMKDGLGYCGLIVVIDTITEEITPQLLVTATVEEYTNAIGAASMMPSRKSFKVDETNLNAKIMVSYYEFTGVALSTVSDIDTRSVVDIIAEIVSNDMVTIMNYIKSINGDRTRMLMESGSTQTDDGLVIKEGNRFTFPDGIIVYAKNIFTGRDGSFSWDYDLVLSNEIMRGAKNDASFANKNLNQGARSLTYGQAQPVQQPQGYNNPQQGYNNPQQGYNQQQGYNNMQQGYNNQQQTGWGTGNGYNGNGTNFNNNNNNGGWGWR